MNRGGYRYKSLTDFPAECLYEIFLHLKDNNASLFNCLMVNRNWCRQAIPLLWRKPFKKHSKINVTMPFLLIRTYLSCLSDGAKKRLNIAGCKHNTLLSKPLFPYPLYLRELDFGELDEALDIWLIYGIEYESEPPTLRNVLSVEVYKLLFTNCKSLWNLKIGQWVDEYSIMDIAQIVRTPKTLSTLRHFEFSGDFECLSREALDNLSNILTIMSHFSRDIQYLKVDMTSDDVKCLPKRLRRLIRAQSALKCFVYTHEHSCIIDTKSIMMALATQSKSLVHLVLEAVPLNIACLKFLGKFTNLKSLRFKYCELKCSGINCCKDTGKPLDTVPIVQEDDDVEDYDEFEGDDELCQLKVEKLVFIQNNFKHRTIISMLHIGLKELTVDNATAELLTEVSQRCVNLVYLAIRISRIPVEELYRISSMKLETLIIGWNSSNVNMNLTIQECEKLGKLLPTSLQHLYIDFQMTPTQLEVVLNNCVIPPVISLKCDLLDFEERAMMVLNCLKEVNGFQELRIVRKDAFISQKEIWERNFIRTVELGRMVGIKVAIEREEPFGTYNIQY